MKKAALLILFAACGLVACNEKEEDVCTTCTGYVGTTADTVFSLCLPPETMDNYIDELYRLNNNADQHFVCTDPE